MNVIVKTAGAVMVLAGGCGIGWKLAYQKKQRVYVLQEMLRVLVLLSGDIEYSALDIVEALEKIAGQTVYLSGFLSHIADALARKEGYSLWTLWEQEMIREGGVGELFGKGLNEGTGSKGVMRLIEPEDARIWLELGQQLGILDRETQLHTLGLLEKRIEQQIGIAEEEYRSQARVCRIAGAAVGIFTIIVLL